MSTLLAFVGGLAMGPAAASADSTISVTPAAYNFGTMLQGGEYAFPNDLDYVNVESTGSDPVTIGATSITGADSSQFRFSVDGVSYCEPGRVLNQGESCFVDLEVDLITVGDKSAMLIIESNIAAGQTSIPLSAKVVAPAGNAPTFAAESIAPGLDDGAGSGIEGMSSGDVSGDGYADVAAEYQMGGASDNQMGYLKGQASGGLSAPIGFDLGGGFPGTTAIGNFNAGNDLDVIAATSGQVLLFLNDGTGNLLPGTPITSNEYGFSLNVGDFNDDGKTDFISGGQSSTFDVFLGNGDGTFQAPISGDIGGVDWINYIVTADFEGDGSSDLGITDYDSGGVVMLKSDGDGTFTELDRLDGCGCESAWGLSASDLNRDGRDDLVATIRYQNIVSPYIAHADGSFDRRQKVRLPLVGGYDTNPIAVSTGDLNGDGNPDAVTADYISDSKSVLVGNGDGTFSFGSQGILSGATMPHASAIDNFSDAPGLDIAIGGQWDGSVSSFRNTGQPGQVLDPASLSFGPTASGTLSAPRTVTLSNVDGLAPLVVRQAIIANDASADFVIDGASNCLEAPVLVGSSCSFLVRFKPVGPPGSRDSTLFIDTNNEDVTQITVPLTGQAASDLPTATVSPTSLDFGAVTIGGTGTSSTGITITNDGFVPIDTDAVTITGANPAAFAVGTGCTEKVLAPGETCQISSTFTPPAVGDFSASVEIASDRFAGTLTVPLSGTGTPVPVPGIAVAPASIDFGSIQVGSESPQQALTVTNTGSAPLTGISGSITGTGAGDLRTAQNNCAARILEPGNTCTFAFAFKPTATGARTGTVNIASNVAGAPATVPLNGTGTAKPAPKTTFRKKPKKKYVIKSKKLKQVKVAFKSNLSGSKFQCRIDSKKFSSCKSPKAFKAIKPGKHVIKVRAIKAGKTGKPAVVKFKVVRKKK